MIRIKDFLYDLNYHQSLLCTWSASEANTRVKRTLLGRQAKRTPLAGQQRVFPVVDVRYTSFHIKILLFLKCNQEDIQGARLVTKL